MGGGLEPKRDDGDGGGANVARPPIQRQQAVEEPPIVGGEDVEEDFVEPDLAAIEASHVRLQNAIHVYTDETYALVGENKLAASVCHLNTLRLVHLLLRTMNGIVHRVADI